jgi:hypothetical protein
MPTKNRRGEPLWLHLNVFAAYYYKPPLKRTGRAIFSVFWVLSTYSPTQISCFQQTHALFGFGHFRQLCQISSPPFKSRDSPPPLQLNTAEMSRLGRLDFRAVPAWATRPTPDCFTPVCVFICDNFAAVRTVPREQRMPPFLLRSTARVGPCCTFVKVSIRHLTLAGLIARGVCYVANWGPAPRPP